MNRTTMLLVTALSALAFAVLPGAAFAGTPLTHCDDAGSTCFHFDEGKTSTISTTSGLTVTCTSLSGSGTMGTTGGTIQLTLNGCKESVFGSNCNSTGQASGTILTTALSYDNTYVTDKSVFEPQPLPGVLITPAEKEHFMTFTCAGGISKNEITGNGVMARLTTPACGATASQFVLSFAITAHGQQKYRQITATGTSFDLKDNGTTAALAAEVTAKVPAGVVLTCV